MTLERKPVAYGDLRGWIDALQGSGRAARDRRRGRLEHRARHHHAAGAGARHRPRAAVQQHQGLQQADEPLPPHLRLGAQQQSPHRHDARPAARHARARAGQDRPHDPAGEHRRRASSRPAAARRTSSPARTSISTNFPVALLEPARRRPLSHHLCGRRHQGPGHRRDERRHLSRHGRRTATRSRS